MCVGVRVYVCVYFVLAHVRVFVLHARYVGVVRVGMSSMCVGVHVCVRARLRVFTCVYVCLMCAARSRPFAVPVQLTQEYTSPRNSTLN